MSEENVHPVEEREAKQFRAQEWVAEFDHLAGRTRQTVPRPLVKRERRVGVLRPRYIRLSQGRSDGSS